MPKARLTVLQVLPSLENGGVERGTLEIAKGLIEQGHRALVISAGGRMVDELGAMGAEHFAWPIGKKSLFTLRWVRRLRRFLVEQKVDVLHARSRMPAWIAWLAWRGMDAATRPRFVTTVHGLYSVKRYSAIMTWGEQVIAVSNTAKQYILDNYADVDEQRIRVIPRGVSNEQFPYQYHPGEQWMQAWHQEYPQLQGKKVLILPGRLTRLKGHHDFIEMIIRLRTQGEDVYGLIVGAEDPGRRSYAQELYDRVNKAGLQNVIVFTGNRTDIRDIYAVSDIVLSLSIKAESFGRTVLEPLNMGVPVVGYDHGGVGEILTEIFPQGKVPLSDRTLLTDKVKEILINDVTVNAQSTFVLEKMVDETIVLYQE
ncbi:MAG: glycosyltransferase family 4 protein [Gammaproteobacteria bacterium]|nr:glycosyltransferase family 4 protein [Gammaproteobacteria bacterium]